MLFPTEEQYREWFVRAGFEDVSLVTVAPDWYRDRRSRYAVAVTGRKPAAGPSPLALGATEDLSAPMSARERLRFAGRFVLGSLAGAARGGRSRARPLATRAAIVSSTLRNCASTARRTWGRSTLDSSKVKALTM